jgi:hypothetical protein
MRKGLLVLVFLAICPLLAAQQALNNDSVIQLVKAGLSEDLIISTIHASPGTYDTSANGLIALKSAGVSDKVVTAIVVKASAPATMAPIPLPGAAAEPVAANPDDPSAPHEAGIYALSEMAPDHKMVMLEPSVYSQGKTGGIFTSAVTYGIAKAKIKAVIRNAHSNVRIADPNIAFYFYFEQQGAGLSNASSPFGGTSTPNEYTLLRFDVKETTRETTIGKFNAYGGSGGTDDKAMVAFTYAKIRPGVYKVTLSAPLTKGEYGFVSPSGGVVAGPYISGATGSSRVFDFGVN